MIVLRRGVSALVSAKKKDDKMFARGVTSVPATCVCFVCTYYCTGTAEPPFVFTFFMLLAIFFSASDRGQGWFVIDDREREANRALVHRRTG